VKEYNVTIWITSCRAYTEPSQNFLPRGRYFLGAHGRWKWEGRKSPCI